MKTPWQPLAEILRAELAEYGELLRLFEAQQHSLFERHPSDVLRYAGEIEAQALRLSECRARREKAVAEFATGLGQPGTSTLRSLLPLIEPEARPLLEALVNEVNALLHRVRRTSRHNRMFLARVVELHEDALREARPQAFTKTYSPVGRLSLAGARPAAALHATG